MSTSALIDLGSALVVLDGRDRIAWRPHRTIGWLPARIWPDAGEAAEVQRRIAAGTPALIVLRDAVESVPLLEEQHGHLPPALAALVHETAGDLPILRITALDWLPDDLRRRGLRLLGAGAADVPAALRPPVVLDDPDPAMPHVRFARRLAPCPHLRRDVPALVDHAFPMLRGRAAA
jgi:hypothetical protein